VERGKENNGKLEDCANFWKQTDAVGRPPLPLKKFTYDFKSV